VFIDDSNGTYPDTGVTSSSASYNFSDLGLIMSKTHRIKVQAANSIGAGEFSSELFVIIASEPDNPTQLA